MNKTQLTSVFSTQLEPIRNMVADLLEIINAEGANLEGNCFYYHNTTMLFPDLVNKQTNLYWAGSQATAKICEIGFNAGHSALLFLYNKGEAANVQFTIFDTVSHPYVTPCLQYLQGKFPNVQWNLVEGDSLVTLPIYFGAHPAEIGTYDLVHVDGNITDPTHASDVQYAKQLVKVGGLLILDDTNDGSVNAKVVELLDSGNFEEVDVLKTYGYEHRVLTRIA